MFPMILLWLGTLTRVFRSRRDLVVENLILRHQLVVLKRRHPRPKLGMVDKLFWLGVLLHSTTPTHSYTAPLCSEHGPC